MLLILFIIFMLLFLPAVIKAISKIKADHKKRKRAQEKWVEFEKEN